jgi:uncharacterized glyoxalase superfamily protein PhnB
MKPAPTGWPRISSSVTYADPLAAIEFLVSAFGFQVRIKVEDPPGTLVHSELTYGDGLVMVGGEASKQRDEPWRKSPRSAGGANTQQLMIYVDDCDAFVAHATANGAKLTWGPQTNDHGADYWSDRSAQLADPEGHHWYITQRLRSPAA